MKKSVCGASLGLALAAMFAAAPAAAVQIARTITQTASYNQSFTTTTQYNNNPNNVITSAPPLSFLFAQFNPIGSQGQTLTLTGVRIQIARNLGGTVTLVNGSANARTGNLEFRIDSSFNVTVGSTPVTILSNTVGNGVLTPFSIPRQSQGNIGLGGGGGNSTNTSFTATDLAPFTGTGNLTVAHSLANFFSDVILAQGGKGNLNGTSTANINGSFEVVYDYLDPVPEPDNWVLLLAGFGMIGVMARHRQLRSVAA